jgi:hypothetical protein
MCFTEGVPMLLLTSTSDAIQIVTGQAVALDVHTSWADYASGTVTPGRTNTAITTATTTSVAGSPAASTQRNVKSLHLRNKDASLSVDVTVRHTDGTTIVELIKITLAAGDSLEYIEGVGFFKVPNPVNPPASNYIASDQTINAATTAYIAGSDVHASAGRPFKAGTIIRWWVFLSKTAAGVAARTLDVRFGTAGTTADTSRGNLAVTPTANIDSGLYLVSVTFRSIGASGVCAIAVDLLHKGATTGLSTGAAIGGIANATFDNTGTNLIAGLSITTGAAEVLTITQVNTEVDNI